MKFFLFNLLIIAVSYVAIAQEKESTANVSDERKKELDSFFSLELDPDKEEDYKSDTGKKILGEFTSIFKGFS